MIKSLNQRTNALKKLKYICEFGTRKIIANGIFMSKLSYMITVWSSCSKELIQCLQVIQNRAAKAITRNDWTVSTEETLRQVGWMSIFQLSHYHTILQIHNIKIHRTPEYLSSMYDWNYNYPTRQATNELIKPKGIPRLDVSKRSFRWRAASQYNQMPQSLTQIEDIGVFKKELKTWIFQNIPLKP